ncbi:MAG TPA: hypothetical protein VF290_23295 [Pyrinomonadaceae bacterium]
MTNKPTPAQMMGALVAFAALIVYALTTTAIVRKWPDTATWIMWATLVFFIVVLAWAYRAARSRLHNFKGSKWAAAVLLLGGDTTSNGRAVTPTQSAIGFAILMLVIFTKSAIVLIWPDYPVWVSWVELSIALAVAAFFIYKLARKKTPGW